jgi:uncharacterized protein (TIGR02996 family)
MSNAILGTCAFARLHRNLGTVEEPLWQEVDPSTGRAFEATSDEDALLAAIILHPHEDTPRLVYADWLQEHGDEERAEFIRAECEIARHCEMHRPRIATAADTKRQQELFIRENVLVRGGIYGRVVDPVKSHLKSMGIDPSQCVYNRGGWLAVVACTASAWLTLGGELQGKYPITAVSLKDRFEISFRDEDNAHRHPQSQFTLRVCARGFVPGELLPDRCFLSSPGTDVLIEDFLCGFIPDEDFRRAVFDRFWPGLEVREPSVADLSVGIASAVDWTEAPRPTAPEPSLDESACEEIAFGSKIGRDQKGFYRRRIFAVRAGSCEHAIRRCAVRTGNAHPDYPRFRATEIVAQAALGINNAWNVTVTYRPKVKVTLVNEQE